MEDPEEKASDRMETIIERMERLQREAASDPANVPGMPTSYCVQDDPIARETLGMMMDELLEQLKREHAPNSEEVQKMERHIADFKAGRDLL